MSGVIEYSIYDGMPLVGIWQTTPNPSGPAVTPLGGMLQYRVAAQPAYNQRLSLTINDPQPTAKGSYLAFDLRASTLRSSEIQLTLPAGVILRFTGNGAAATYQWWNGSFQTLAASGVRADGAWHRIVMAFSPGQVTLFEDGARKFSWSTAVGATVSPCFHLQALDTGSNVALDVREILVLPPSIGLSPSTPWDYGFTEGAPPPANLMTFRTPAGGPQVSFASGYARFAAQAQSAVNTWSFLDVPRAAAAPAVLMYPLRVNAAGGSETKITLPGDNILRFTADGGNWCSWSWADNFQTLAASSIAVGAPDFTVVALVVGGGGISLLENGVWKYDRAYAAGASWNPGLVVQHLDRGTSVSVDVGGLRTLPTTKPVYTVAVDTSAVPGSHAYTFGAAPPLGTPFQLGRYGVQVTGKGYLRVECEAGGVTLNGGPLWTGSGTLTVSVRPDGSFTTSAPAQTGNLLTEFPVAPPPSPALTSLTFAVQTGSSGGSWYDGPGTNADLSITIGDPNGRNTGWVGLDNWGDDLEAGNWDTYDIPVPAGMTLADLKQFTLQLQIPTMLSFNDAWNVAQVKITANGSVVYDNTHANAWLNSAAGSTNTWTQVISVDGSGLDRRYDQNCFLCAHNAYAAEDEGWWIAQQRGSVADQLAHGVRALMLDVWPYPYPKTAASRATLCHELGTWQNFGLDYFMKPFSSYKPLEDELRSIKTFADANPAAVITLIFESYVDQALMQAAFDAVPGLRAMLVVRDQPLSGWNWSDGWPTLRWMGSNNKRIVVFTSAPADGFPRVWDYAVENVYGDASRDHATWVDNRRESAPLGAADRSLCILNHFPTIAFRALMWSTILTLRTLAIQNYYHSQVNDGDEIRSQIEACRARYGGRLPNFVAVDFYELGNNGGPMAAVRAANAAWAER